MIESPFRVLERHWKMLAQAAAGAMLVFFASFVWALSVAVSAIAAPGEACHGENLIERIATEDPERLAHIEEQAAATLNGEGVFWRVSREGVADSWLLGTMHLANDRIAGLEGARLAALSSADTVVVENTDALDRQKAMKGLIANKDLTLITDGTSLADRLPPETLEKLKLALDARGMPERIALIMQPWMVAAAIALPACEQAAKSSGKQVLDARIAQFATENGKQLAGLESMREQFEAMASVPEDFQLQSLKETLDMGPQAENIAATLQHLYLEGRIGMILPFTRSMTPRTEATGGYGAFTAALVDKRNVQMGERVLPHVEAGNAFIAVGALHLPGETGLVEALRRAGYEVTRVE